MFFNSILVNVALRSCHIAIIIQKSVIDFYVDNTEQNSSIVSQFASVQLPYFHVASSSSLLSFLKKNT